MTPICKSKGLLGDSTASFSSVPCEFSGFSSDTGLSSFSLLKEDEIDSDASDDASSEMSEDASAESVTSRSVGGTKSGKGFLAISGFKPLNALRCEEGVASIGTQPILSK